MTNKTYKKLIVTRFGENFRDSVAIVEIPQEKPVANEVLIRNRYAGINAIIDTNIALGLVTYLPITPPVDMGSEAIGYVEAIGENVTDFAIGDAVAASGLGQGYREYQICDADRLYKVKQPSPEILTLISTGASALICLEQVAKLKSDEVVVVSAAAGGLGHILVQLAKLAGNHVIGLCGSKEKCEVLKRIGCDRPINYKNEDINKVLSNEYSNGIDLAIDSVGGPVYDALVDHLAERGRLVVCGRTHEAGRPWEQVFQTRPASKLYSKSASIMGFMSRHFQTFWPAAVERILDLYDNGQLSVFVDPTPFQGLEDIPNAIDHLLAGKNIGKVIVRIEN